MAMLASLSSVDWVVPFAEDTPLELIKKISPNVLVKGGDYTVHEIAGSHYVVGCGGEVIIIPFEKGFSTSATLKKIESSLSITTLD
jgi:D-beta-D-heptose 7-phosphate kinase/D-beta-D-heptose 1-phosphate adenosyltransferase